MTLFKKLLLLFLSISMTIIATFPTFVIADPINETVIAKGTLSGIVSKNYPNTKLSKAQIMIAILAANPRAFRGGNINFMSRNKKLSLPSEAMIASIPVENAEALLVQHNHFYQQGKTGNLTPPTFIKIDKEDTAALDKLKSEYSAQTERVQELATESTKLQSLVEHLEAEKNQRDEDLRLLEEKIQLLKESGGKRLPEEESENEQRLRERNAALLQQLVESKSELIENNRTTISLERRVLELQKKQENIPNTLNTSSAPASNDQYIDNSAMPVADTANTSADIPTTDLNGNIISPEEGIFTNFDLSKMMWLLPLIALLVGVGVLLKRVFTGRKHADLNLDEIDDFDFATPKMTDTDRKDAYRDTANESTNNEAPLEVSIKLDVARAYMEADDNQSAYEMLQEVLREGNKDQQEEATLLLKRL